MISNYKNALQHLSRTGSGSSNLVEPGLEHELIQFCLTQQRERMSIHLWTFHDEPALVQLQILSSLVKLYLEKPIGSNTFP
jgi:hypothetical protein